ncbi:hypothetical protein H2203_001426 [Taxawa tesnikishii (nom. ined.)]|nr:hypothetical protein H2203_001426 [Dothideales sp. JES 119]
MKAVDVPTFATSQLSLLSDELEAETEETALLTSTHAPSTLARAGLAILNLSVSSQRTGLGGKTLLDLELDPAVAGASKELPEHGIRVGDIVGVAEQPKGAERKKEREGLEKKGVTGVVVKVQKESVVVALDKEDVDVPGGKLWLWVVRLLDVTGELSSQDEPDHDPTAEDERERVLPLTRVLFGQSSPAPVSPSDLEKPVEWIDPSLNDSQKDAIRFALASREIALVHGPPGTGKTHTLIELILQLIKQELRLLVCGPSNISVDNIVERLAPHKLPIVRMGHPARLLPSVLDHSLEVLTRTSDAAALVKDIRNELDAKQASIRKTRNGRERKAIYGEMKGLRKEYRERETKCVENLVRESKVVLATLHGAGGYNLKGQRFDVVIVDEASQALEAQCWVPLLSSGADKVVLAGDHLQLPPTIKSSNISEMKRSGKDGDVLKKKTKDDDVKLETTLFDRMLALHGNSIKRMLTTQYRMHEKIMAFPSAALYESKLIAADAVKARLLTGLPYEIRDTEDTREPLVFWDTQGGDFPEKTDVEDLGRSKASLFGESKCNEHEVALVRLHVQNLVDAGLRPEDIAIVTPYNGQLAILSKSMKEEFPGIELGSVDGFQGREKEAVVVSLVRSNPEHEVGFLGRSAV